MGVVEQQLAHVIMQISDYAERRRLALETAAILNSQSVWFDYDKFMCACDATLRTAEED